MRTLVIYSLLISTAQVSEPAVANASPATKPQEQPDVRQDRPLTIKLADGHTLGLRGFRVLAKHGLSDAQCGVIIGGQRLMTLGEGETEIYTCDELVAAGALPPDRGLQRIGLIYDWSTRNANARTAVILREEHGRWLVDTSTAGRFDGVPAGRSIPALRRALR